MHRRRAERKLVDAELVDLIVTTRYSLSLRTNFDDELGKSFQRVQNRRNLSTACATQGRRGVWKLRIEGLVGERERGGKETERAASCDIFVSARSGGTPVSLMTVHTNNQ